MPRRWWQDPSYPVAVWTAEDRAAALREGWRPPRDTSLPRLGDEKMLIAPVKHPLPGGFQLNPRTTSAAERSKRVDALIAALGLGRR
jgi:hypothetical protein